MEPEYGASESAPKGAPRPRRCPARHMGFSPAESIGSHDEPSRPRPRAQPRGLVGVVAVVVQLSLFWTQHEGFAANECFGRISVTKAGEPLLSEAVLVSDNSPNEGRIADYRRPAFNITYR